jgi:hypothetical protein
MFAKQMFGSMRVIEHDACDFTIKELRFAIE